MRKVNLFLTLFFFITVFCNIVFVSCQCRNNATNISNTVQCITDTINISNLEKLYIFKSKSNSLNIKRGILHVLKNTKNERLLNKIERLLNENIYSKYFMLNINDTLNPCLINSFKLFKGQKLISESTFSFRQMEYFEITKNDSLSHLTFKLFYEHHPIYIREFGIRGSEEILNYATHCLTYKEFNKDGYYGTQMYISNITVDSISKDTSLETRVFISNATVDSIFDIRNNSKTDLAYYYDKKLSKETFIIQKETIIVPNEQNKTRKLNLKNKKDRDLLIHHSDMIYWHYERYCKVPESSVLNYFKRAYSDLLE